jgi:predicted SprT family Zn-dependent metalloprotease
MKIIPLCLGVMLTACSPAPTDEERQIALQNTFNEVCELAELDCSDIEIKYESLDSNILGMANLYNSGRMTVGINHIYKGNSAKVRGIVTHEVSHLVVFSTSATPHKHHHGRYFKNVCKSLSYKAKVSQEYCTR